MTTEAFEEKVREIFDTTTHPTLGVPYTQVAYRPMIELVDLLKDNDFHVSSAGRWARFRSCHLEEAFGIARDRMIGSPVHLSIATAISTGTRG